MEQFNELNAYVGLGDDDVARLAEMRPVVEPHFAAIVGAFTTH